MGRILQLGLLVGLVTLANSARAAWTVRFSASSFPAAGTGHIDLSVINPDVDAVSWSSPDGTIAGGTGVTLKSGSFGNFADFQASQSATGAWTLTATKAGVTSTYRFTPDFSGVDAATLPVAHPVTPTAGQYFSSLNLLLKWNAPSGVAIRGYAYVDHPGAGLDHYSETITKDSAETWALSVARGADYSFGLMYYAPTFSIPLSTELVNGPDLGLPASANLFYDSEYIIPFNVLPEPTGMTALLPAGIGLLATGRRRRANGRSVTFKTSSADRN